MLYRLVIAVLFRVLSRHEAPNCSRSSRSSRHPQMCLIDSWGEDLSGDLALGWLGAALFP
mgnify:CR=1 FL=1